MTTQAEDTARAGGPHDGLKPGTTLLQGQYVIDAYLNSGGFGMTYLARDSLERPVVIKECFPASFCCRDNDAVRARSRSHEKDFQVVLRHFVREARRLSRLDHPNIVGVHQVFEDNDTAYMALDYVEGQNLLDIADDASHCLSPERLRRMLLKILEAVAFIHAKGILHRDISPDNILLDAQGEPILIDFGAAREKASRASRALSALVVVKDGYSPQEFYLAGSEQGPASDLYSLAATFYHILTGDPPPDSQTRLAAVAAEEDDPYVALVALRGKLRGYERAFLAAIDKALNLFARDRFQSARDWIVEIDTDRRVALALARARRDRNMEREISRLVSETNEALARENAEAAAAAAAAAEAERQEPEQPRVYEYLSAEPDEAPDGAWDEAGSGVEPEDGGATPCAPAANPVAPEGAGESWGADNAGSGRAGTGRAGLADHRARLLQAARPKLSIWRRFRRISVWRLLGGAKRQTDNLGRTG